MFISLFRFISMHIELSQRLNMIANMVRCQTLADIGTDHGYIPIAALERGYAKKALACDVNPKPLQRAKENIAAAGLEKAIETRLGSGFQPLSPGEADGAVLAGMGGLLMLDILKENPEITQGFTQLVLSPHTHVPEVREGVLAMGFTITEEAMVLEDDQYYIFLNCQKGIEPPYNAKERLLGRRLLETRPPVFLDFVQYRLDGAEAVMAGINPNHATEAAKTRLEELQALAQMYREILAQKE